MRASILIGDALEQLRGLADGSVQCVVTSPPYWGLRDYGTAQWEGGDAGCDHRGRSQTSDASTLGEWKNGGGQIYKEGAGGMPFAGTCGKCGATRIDAQLGLERTPELYVANMVAVFREVRRVLRDDGTLWLNLGDSYASGEVGRHDARENPDGPGATSKFIGTPRQHLKQQTGLKPKDLVGIPWRVAFALRADGWWLRQDIVWSKPNPMPESVTDRCTKAHEYLFLLSKSAQYYFNAAAIAERRVSDHDAGSFRGGCYVEGEIDNGTMGKRKTSGDSKDVDPYRNKRSVWEIATRPFSGASLLADYVGADGKPYRRSEDCPVHGLRRGSKTRQMVSRDAPPDPCLSDTSDTSNHPDQAPECESSSIPRKVAQCNCTMISVDHFATYPEALVEPCILAGSKEGDTVLDPFCGSGTTGCVALRYHRDFIGIELNADYAKMAERRIGAEMPLYATVTAARGGEE